MQNSKRTGDVRGNVCDILAGISQRNSRRVLKAVPWSHCPFWVFLRVLGRNQKEIPSKETILGPPERCPFSPLLWLGGFLSTKIDYKQLGTNFFYPLEFGGPSIGAGLFWVVVPSCAMKPLGFWTLAEVLCLSLLSTGFPGTPIKPLPGMTARSL